MVLKSINPKKPLSFSSEKFLKLVKKLKLDREEKEFILEDLAHLDYSERIEWLNDLISGNI